jgi:hypothetical protein
MNNLTEKEEIQAGAIIKVYVNDRFEGWARLIEKVKAKYDTFIDNNVVYVRERWRIQFVEPHQVPGEMTREELWNQISLKGIITFRHIIYFGERTWELFVAKYGIPSELRLNERADKMEEMDKDLNYDDNFIF